MSTEIIAPESVIHVRIDDRLIHGQVATMWTNQIGATRIMVIDDQAASDDVLKMSLKVATPSGVALSVLTVDRAVERLTADAYHGQRVFVIVKTPFTLLRMLSLGIRFPVVNVGNLTYVPGKTKVSNTAAVSDDEVEAFHALKDRGVSLTMQLIPSNPSNDFIQALDASVPSA